ncbi:hypothetical protein Emag_000517 [Eimeria magna]
MQLCRFTMIMFRTAGFHAKANSRVGHLDFEESPILASRGRDLQEETNGVVRWRSQRTGRLGFVKCLLAVSVVSLTLVYVVVRCIEYAAFIPKVRAASRSLAGGDSDKDLCRNWPDGGNRKVTPANEEETLEGGAQAESLLAATRGAQAPRGQQSELSSPLQSPNYVWGHQQMLPRGLGRATGLLFSTKQLATTGMELLAVLSPSQALELCEQLVVVAVIELAALAYVPSALQRLRSETAQAFVRMVSLVMSNDATRKALLRVRLKNRFERLRSMIGRVGGTPSTSAMLTIDRDTMDAWVDAGTYAVTQASAQLQNLLHPHEWRPPSPQVMQKSLNVLRAIYVTRKTQLLRNRTLRRWLVACHSAEGRPLLYTRREVVELPRKSEQPQTGLLQEVHHAVIAAGATTAQSTMTTSRLETEPPSHRPTVSSPSYFGEAQLQPQYVQQYHFGPSAENLAVGSPAASRRSDMSQQTPDRYQLATPLQPQPQGQTSQQKLSFSAGPAEAAHSAASLQNTRQLLQGASSHWEQLGARPRQEAAPVEHVRAESLGWGYRQMPAEWRARVRGLLELMRTAATTCDSLLCSLSPGHAVLLPMYLSNLAAVGLSALAYIPADMQPLRAAVGASYQRLLERILTKEPLWSSAAKKGLTTRILCLQVAIERLSGEPPYAAIEVDEYAKKTCVHYRVCKYAFLQVSSLFEGLMPLQQPSSGRLVDAEVVVRATSIMVSVLKMNLLVDMQMRWWFISQAGNLQYPLFTRKDLDKASPRAVMTTRIVVHRLQNLLLKAGVSPIDLEKGESPFVREPQSFRAAVGEQLGSGVRHTLSQDLQQDKPVVPTSHGLRLTFESEQRSSQPPPTSAVSPQGSSRPAPPVWSVVPTSLSGFPRSSMWTWSWEDRGPTEQRLPQDYFGLPCIFSSGSSFEPTAEGVSGSWGEERHQESSGGAAGELGLLDLAARVSQWDLSDSEEAEEGRVTLI